MKNDNNLIFLSGIKRVHTSIPGASADIDKQEHANMAARMNTKQYLEENLLNRDVLYSRTLENRGKVVTMKPSAGYGFESVMIVAAGQSFFDLEEDQQAPSEVVYDYDSEVKKEYFRQMLAWILAKSKTPFPGYDGKLSEVPEVVAVENTTFNVANAKQHVGRTIALPHMQILKGSNGVDTNEMPTFPDHLVKEQILMQNYELIERFIEKLNLKIKDNFLTSDNIPEITIRTTAPYGYTLNTQIKKSDDFESQVTRLEQIMSANHQSYTKLAKEKVLEEHILGNDETMDPIEQPSYRTYVYYDKSGELKVTISPVIISGTGVLDAAGVYLDRSGNHPKPCEADDLAQYVSAIVNQGKSYLTSKNYQQNYDTKKELNN